MVLEFIHCLKLSFVTFGALEAIQAPPDFNVSKLVNLCHVWVEEGPGTQATSKQRLTTMLIFEVGVEVGEFGELDGAAGVLAARKLSLG